MEPEKGAREHLFAAKNYTALKHEARSLHESFKESLKEDDFFHEVRKLRERYNALVQFTPPTDDKKAWEEARRKIKKEKVHEPDK